MAIEIHCYEPENRPHRAQLTLGEGVTSFWVYLLTEVTEHRKQREGLRWTALGALRERGAELHPGARHKLHTI